MRDLLVAGATGHCIRKAPCRRSACEGAPTSYSTAYVAANSSRFATLAGESDEAIRQARKALEMAEEIGNDALRSHALNNIGIARITLGDFGGLDDLEECVRIAVEANSPESVRAYGNLGSVLLDLGQIARSLATTKEGLKLAQRFGLGDWLGWLESELIWEMYYDGRWGEALTVLDRYVARFVETQFWMETPCRWLRARIRLSRDDLHGAEEDAARALERARLAKDPQVLWPALAIGARVFAATDVRHADSLAGELLSRWENQGLSVTGGSSEWTGDLPPALAALGREEEFLGFVARIERTTPWLTAATLVAQRDYADAAAAYSEIGDLPSEAMMRLRAAGQLVEQGRRAEADAELRQALPFWRAAGATRYVLEGESLLAASA